LSKTQPAHSTNVFFENNSLLPALYGDQDANLKRLEKLLQLEIVPRGNMLSISGAERDVVLAEEILMSFYDKLNKGAEFSLQDLDAAVRLAPPVTETKSENIAGKVKRKGIKGDLYIKTFKKTIEPYTHMQANYMRALYDYDLTFALGPAGTGKTYIAMAMAVYMYMNQRVERIILSRPAVEAGEKLGFLPGSLQEKIDPYLRPLYDALFDMLPADKVNNMMQNGEIEVAPLAFMRGRTLSNAFIVLDEAQNTTSTQMKMFLTRLGEGSRMVITGDLSQVDLPKDVKSGLHDSIRKIGHVDGIATIHLTNNDVVRNDIVARIVQAYDDWDRGVRPERPKIDDSDIEPTVAGN
jgi:phosphate starvation-inducible protein PhoH and related proteins